MPRSITISLPVTDVAISKDFYAALGFVVDPQFTDTSTTFLRLSEAIQLVLPLAREVERFHRPRRDDPRRRLPDTASAAEPGRIALTAAAGADRPIACPGAYAAVG